MTLSAATDLTFTEDVKKRFNAYGGTLNPLKMGMTWRQSSGDQERAKKQRAPSLILVQTHLGYGSPNKQDTLKRMVHPWEWKR
jgi:transketolase